MDIHGWIAVATLAAVILLFITKWIPLEATALSIPVVLALTGTLKPEQVLTGFGNPAVIALGGVFILGAGLKESGVATLMARGLERLGGGSPLRTLFVIMIPACLLSGFMSSAATVAVFLPAVSALARRTGTPVSKLMMPLGYAALLGGTLTLIGTTPNLILGEEVRQRTGEGLGMFDFLAVGAPVAALGIVYMAFVGYRLLPNRHGSERLRGSQLPEELAREFQFEEHLFRLMVVPASRILGRTIAEAEISSKYDLSVVHVLRPGGLTRKFLHPEPDLVLQTGDQLLVEGDDESAWRFCEEDLLQFGLARPKAAERLMERGVTLSEVMLSPHSRCVGQTLRELKFRNVTGLSVLSLWRKGDAIPSGFADIPLELGDAFLVSGTRERVRELSRSPEYIVMGDRTQVEDVGRAPLAAGILLLALLPSVFGWLPLAVSALGGALLMIGTRCISLTGAQRAIDFRILFLIIGTIPLGKAMEVTGVAREIGAGIVALEGALGEPAVFLALFALSSVLSTTCNNGAAAVILAPVAAQVAAAGNVDVTKAFLAVAYGASCVFALPFGNQVNLMVMGPGGYKTKDFMKVGSGLAVLMAVATVTLLWAL